MYWGNNLDDRAYTLALLSYALTLKRTADRLSRARSAKKKNIAEIVPMNIKKSGIKKMIG